MSAEDNPKLITVTWPVLVPPLCLELAHGTRVCAVRVDSAEVLRKTVRAGVANDKLYGFVWRQAVRVCLGQVECAKRAHNAPVGWKARVWKCVQPPGRARRCCRCCRRLCPISKMT